MEHRTTDGGQPLPDELDGCQLVEHRFTDEDYRRLAQHDRALLVQQTSKRACAAKRQVGERRARRDARCLRQRGEQVHAYACDRCRGWHVGHDAVAHVPAARTSLAARRARPAPRHAA